MAFSIDYLLNHDIDIFLRIEKQTIHVASAGALLPPELAQLDSMLIKNKSIIYDINTNTDITINPYLDDLLQFNSIREKDLYLSDFKRIASKGIITFDKTIVEDSNDPFYHVVAWPNPKFVMYDIENILPIETPDYISNKISKNIQENILQSWKIGKKYDKFELFKNI